MGSILCLNTETPKTINSSFGTSKKLMIFGVPVFTHFGVAILSLAKLYTAVFYLKIRYKSSYQKSVDAMVYMT